MIEHRIGKELDRDYINFKVKSLTLLLKLNVALIILAVVFFLTYLFVGILDERYYWSMAFIPAYKIITSMVLLVIIHRKKHNMQELQTNVYKLNHVIFLYLLALTLSITAWQQLIALVLDIRSISPFTPYGTIIISFLLIYISSHSALLKGNIATLVFSGLDITFYRISISCFLNVGFTKFDIFAILNTLALSCLALGLNIMLCSAIKKAIKAYTLKITSLNNYKVQAETDALTALSNRHALKLDLDIIAHRKAVKNVAIAMFDIDDFKKFNDTYGHQVGDEVLSQVGQLLKTFNVTEGTEAYRYGGEEMLIVFSSYSNDLIYNIEMFRQAVRQIKIHNINTHITISGGVAVGSIDDDLSIKGRKEYINSLVKKADDLLYEAKNTGKNKIVHAIS